MNKTSLEKLTSSIAVSFLSILTVGAIILIADLIFQWNIFSPPVEKALSFIMISLGFIIFSSVIVNIMINISIIAASFTEFIQSHEKGNK